MTITIDTRERYHEKGEQERLNWLRAQCDAVKVLPCDFEVQAASGRRYTWERKVWNDFVNSWKEGKLDRQVAAANGLILEYDPMEADLEIAGDPARQLHHNNARLHLFRLAASAWVVQTRGPQETMHFLRWLERQDSLDVRPNKVRGRGEDIIYRFLDQLPRVNPHAITAADEPLGAILAPTVDREALHAALHVEAWPRSVAMAGGKTWRFADQARLNIKNIIEGRTKP